MRIDRVTLIKALNELRDIFEYTDGDVFSCQRLSKYPTLSQLISNDKHFLSYEDVVRKLCLYADYHVEKFNLVVREDYCVLSFILKDDYGEDRIVELNWIN